MQALFRRRRWGREHPPVGPAYAKVLWPGVVVVGGMFEELKESWGGWRVASELGEQVQTTLLSGLRGPVKECSFCPKIEGF